MVVALVVLCLVAFGMYMWALSYHARKSIEEAPRKDMFICDTHGPIAEGDIIQFDFDGLYEKAQPVCPFCFHDKFKVTKR